MIVAVGNSLLELDMATGEVLREYEGHSDGVTCVAALEDGRFVSGSDDNTLRVWRPGVKEAESVHEGHSGGVKCVAAFEAVSYTHLDVYKRQLFRSVPVSAWRGPTCRS